MGNKKKTYLALCAALGMAFVLPASAATINLTTLNSPLLASDVAGGGAMARVSMDFLAGNSVEGYTVSWEYDPTLFGVPVPVNPSGTHAGSLFVLCEVDGGTNTFSVATAALAPLADATAVCQWDIPVLTTTGVGDYTFDVSAGFPPVFAGGAGTANGASLSIVDAPPVLPTISFSPNGGAVAVPQDGGAVGAASGTFNITATGAGGVGGGTGSYNCTVPAGFNVTNSSNGSFGNGSADLGVSCTMAAAAASADMSCAVTDANGARNVVFNLTCPAGASAVYSSNPAPGNALPVCDGAPGATVNTSLMITNTGTPANPDTAADDLAVACSIAGAGFSIASGPASPVEAGSSTTVTVACTVPASGTATGTLTCNGNAYPLSSSARTAPPLPTIMVPSGSIWSKLALFGLLAGLGMLVVSLRRNG